MIIYLDLVIITNIIVDYAFLKTIAILYHEKIRWYNLVIALLLGNFSMLLFIIPLPFLYNLRYIIGLLMGLITYHHPEWKKRLLMIISFYIINFVFIGNLVVFKVQNVWLLLVTLVYVIFLTMLENLLNKSNNKIYAVKIKQKTYSAFLDNGNNCVYQGYPVIFIKEEFKNAEFSYLGEMSIQTIKGMEIIKVYSGPQLLLKNKKYQVVYCFSQQIMYEIILNNIMGE